MVTDPWFWAWLVAVLWWPVMFFAGRGRKPKPKIIVAAKTVNNRTMPNYSRAQRRAYKRRKRTREPAG